jgi:CheY-like chemotaxis protein
VADGGAKEQWGTATGFRFLGFLTSFETAPPVPYSPKMSADNLRVVEPLEVAAPPPDILRPPLLVFHVNDSTDDQVLFQAACKQANVPFHWHVAESAERGISYLASLVSLSQTQSVRWPDLVVLDIVMPGGSGLKVLEHIRSTPKISPLPVVILTGHSTPEIQEAATRLGANSFYEKPTSFSGMVELVSNLYRIWSAARRPNP